MKKLEINGYSKSEGETLYYLHRMIVEELRGYEGGRLLEIAPGGFGCGGRYKI